MTGGVVSRTTQNRIGFPHVALDKLDFSDPLGPNLTTS